MKIFYLGGSFFIFLKRLYISEYKLSLLQLLYSWFAKFYIEFDTKDPVEEGKGYEEDWRILLLWDFDVDQILSANTSGVAAVIPDADDICVTPLLEVNAGSCNCPNFPATDKVLLSTVDETRERGNSPQPLAGNDDTVDAPNVNIQTRSLVLTGIRRCDVCDFVSTA